MQTTAQPTAVPTAVLTAQPTARRVTYRETHRETHREMPMPRCDKRASIGEAGAIAFYGVSGRVLA